MLWAGSADARVLVGCGVDKAQSRAEFLFINSRSPSSFGMFGLHDVTSQTSCCVHKKSQEDKIWLGPADVIPPYNCFNFGSLIKLYILMAFNICFRICLV